MRKVLFIIYFLNALGGFSQYTSEDAEPDTSKTEQQKNSLSGLKFKERLYTGGNISIGFTNGYGLILVNPIVGYKITDKFSAGLGGKYIYFGTLGNKSGAPTYRSTIYGGSVFSRYLFSQTFFGHAEFELLNAYNRNPNVGSYSDRALAKMLLMGAGYNNTFGGSVSAQIMLLYDFINDINSPYQGNYLLGPTGPPIIYRIGFTIGI